MASSSTNQHNRRVVGLIRRAARRLTLNLLIDALCVLATVAAGAAFVTAAWAFLAGGAALPWGWIVMWLVVAIGGALVIVAPWVAVSRQSAAIVLDERLGLNDAFSTAMAFEEDSSSPVCAAQRAAAATLADHPRVRRGVSAAVPMAVPRRWWWPAPLAIAAIVVAWLPPLGASPPPADPRALAQTQLNTDEMLKSVRDALANAPDLAEEVGGDLDLEIPDDLTTPEQIRQEAIKRLTAVNRRLDEFNVSPEQATLERVRERLRSLPTGSGDAATPLRRALTAGDFEAAQAALESLQAGAESDAADRAAALEALAQDLQNAAEAEDAAAAAVRAAGLDPADLDDLPRLEKKIDASKNLSPAQKEELKRLLNSECAGSKAVEGLASECQSAASQCRNPSKERGNSTKSQCQGLAKCQRQSDQASACRSACRGAAANASSGSRPGPGGMSPRGGGRGNPGTSEETSRVATRADTAIDRSAAVVAASPVAGPIRGGGIGQAVGPRILEAKRRAAEGVDVRRIPKRYREAVAAWFASRPAETGQAAEPKPAPPEHAEPEQP
ncbi:MAG: hypothetical protein QF561_03995 [Phycisphaerales bacterium]|jgi:hypothetical protein|nr:hypothetical protein [Phycisphaerales bacterium]